MISFVLSHDVLGRTRFAFSPLGEVTLSLRVLGAPRVDVHRPWLTDVRRRLDQVDVELLLAVAPPGKWVATCLMASSDSPTTTMARQLQTLTEISPDELCRDLTEVWSGDQRPRRVEELIAAGPRGPGILAEALWDYWDVAVGPYWNRMCAVLEDDVSYRVATLVADGLFTMLGELHPEISVSGDRLQIDKPQHADSAHHAGEMTLTPSVFAWPGLILGDGEPGAFSLPYGARGVAGTWEGL